MARYDSLSESNKNIVLLIAGSVAIIFMMELFLFNVKDKSLKLEENYKIEYSENINLLEQKKVLLLERASKSNKNLEKMKSDLVNEITNLINGDNSLKKSDTVKIIEEIVFSYDKVKLIELKAKTLIKNDGKKEILTHHIISLKINADYRTMYELIKKIDSLGSIYINKVIVVADGMGKNDVIIDLELINLNKGIIGNE